jgi:hypothetical protein
MTTWEYTTADLTKVEKDVSELNRLGAAGWEAVGMVSTWGAGGFRFVHPIALLKRPVTSDAGAEHLATASGAASS